MPPTDADATPRADAPEGRSGGSGALHAVAVAVREFVVVVVMALLLALVVKTWLVQAFFIPSGSMEQTLVLNDRVVVNKLVPGVMDLRRGDVVVFRDPGGWLGTSALPERTGLDKRINDALVFVGLLPSQAEDHLIKRVVGLPGDHVVCCEAGKIAVNGTPITEPYLMPGDAPSTVSFDITVPADRIWVMGDHRSDSEDSRFHDPGGTGQRGSVPIADVTGRAFALVWPLDRMSWLSDYPAVFADVPAPKS